MASIFNDKTIAEYKAICDRQHDALIDAQQIITRYHYQLSIIYREIEG